MLIGSWINKEKTTTMAKAKGKASGSSGAKLTFGSRKGGKLKRKYGPKEEKPKKYRGQGR
jgi:hypothetical protein